MGSIPPWTARGSYFGLCELCGFWYLVWSERLRMPNAEQ